MYCVYMPRVNHAVLTLLTNCLLKLLLFHLKPSYIMPQSGQHFLANLTRNKTWQLCIHNHWIT